MNFFFCFSNIRKIKKNKRNTLFKNVYVKILFTMCRINASFFVFFFKKKSNINLIIFAVSFIQNMLSIFNFNK